MVPSAPVNRMRSPNSSPPNAVNPSPPAGVVTWPETTVPPVAPGCRPVIHQLTTDGSIGRRGISSDDGAGITRIWASAPTKAIVAGNATNRPDRVAAAVDEPIVVSSGRPARWIDAETAPVADGKVTEPTAITTMTASVVTSQSAAER